MLLQIGLLLPQVLTVRIVDLSANRDRVNLTGSRLARAETPGFRALPAVYVNL